MAGNRLRQSVDDASLALLNQIDRDPYSRLRGCGDRRFWGWKLVDFPDATLQRAVQPLAWILSNTRGSMPIPDSAVADTIVQALLYTASIQHPDGSFDQAYPHEHSVAGTAFILDSAAAAMAVVDAACSAADRERIHSMFARAASFLCRQDETHGLIANHLAGSVLALVRAESILGRDDFGRRADALLDRVLAAQSSEGWFPEYDGCDPGYLSLCVYYLAQVRNFRPGARLTDALGRAVTFLAHFIHPDGTFGGIYGSRRTSVYYPGGVALLAAEMPLAARMTALMLQAADDRRLVGPGHPDIGNAVPVLANFQLALGAAATMPDASSVALPFETAGAVDFPVAGLYLRASSVAWVIIGASNGGTVSVWDRATGRRVHDDGGWVAEAGRGRWTTQVTDTRRAVRSDGETLTVVSGFRRMQQRVPSAFPFVVLRLAGVLLRFPSIGERVKRMLVNLLLRTGAAADARVERTVRVTADGVVIDDTLSGSTSFWKSLTRLECGRPFSAIHMASAGYVVATEQMPRPAKADLAALVASGSCHVSSSPALDHTHGLPS